MSEEHDNDVGTARSFDPERGAFAPPHHPPLRDRETNPRGVRHIDETAQDHMAVADRPRYQAAQARRSRMIASAIRRLKHAASRRRAPSRSVPDDPKPPWSPSRSDMDATPAPADLHHTQTLELDWEEVVEALAALEGSRVAVRVIERSEPEVLVVVFRGHLGEPTRGKHPTLFWPVRAASEDEPGNVEDTGIHLHRDRFQGSLASPGREILHIVQGPVIVNVRGV